MNKPRKFLLINQYTGYLFIDIVNAFAESHDCTLFAGQVEPLRQGVDPRVKTVMLKRYNRSTAIKRVFTWGWFTLQAFFRLLFTARDQELFIVSNPPSAPMLGYVMHRLKGMKYHLLIYDVYPDALVQVGMIGQSHFINRIWSRWNKKIIGKAQTVYTLSDNMARLIHRYAPEKEVKVVPVWTDTSLIRPVLKAANPFAAEHSQLNKLTVMYSGNLGLTHAVDKLVDVAILLRENHDISFMIIGEGARKEEISRAVQTEQLHHVRMLPYQPGDIFPYSIACADIGIVTLSAGSEHLSVPSKTFNLLAAGVALLVIAAPDSELARLVDQYDCGAHFQEHQVKEIAAFILSMKQHPERLQKLKDRARKASLNFTPANARKYREWIEETVYVR